MQRLSSLQLAILRVLWARGRASIAEVQAAVDSKRKLAYSTLATVLKRMEAKGVVRHVAEGRTFIYEPLVDADAVGHSVVASLVETVFAGSPAELVSHLLESHEVEPEELARIQALIDEHRKTVPSLTKTKRRKSP